MVEPAQPPGFDERVLSGKVIDVIRELLGPAERADEILAIIAKLVDRNEDLERLLAQMKGAKNRHEHISRDQLALFIAQAAGAATTPDASVNEVDLAALAQPLIDAKTAEEEQAKANPKPRQPRGQREMPAHLRREPNPIEVPEAERACPGCGGERDSLGPETTPVIELKPAEVFVRLDQREKLVCKSCDGHLSRAPSGDKVVEGGLYGPRLVGSLLVDKYDDGLALHRSHARLLRLGLDMPVSSMADQVLWASELLEPLWRYSRDLILASEVMHLDATSLPTLVRKLGKVHQGTLWGMVGRNGQERIAAYVYASTAKGRGQRRDDQGRLLELGPLDILDARQGPVVLDASGTFDAAFCRPTIWEVGCNMHSRRYFVTALEAGDKRASHVIRAYKALYIVEESVHGKSSDEVLKARQEKSLPLWDAMIKWTATNLSREPPRSALGRAMQYTINHHVALGRFLWDGRLPIDNGEVERLHRRPALVRLNSLFAGSHEGGRRAAIVLSLLGSCRLAGVDAVAYLGDVLPRLQRDGPKDLAKLMPAAWAKENGSLSLLRSPTRTVIE